MRRSWPQMPIRKYMGTSETSQNTKNRNRSCAMKTPTSANSSRIRNAWNSLTRRATEFQEISTQIGVRKVVRIISQRLTPLTAMEKWMSGVAIQGTSTVNCSAEAPRSNQNGNPSDAAKAASETASAQTRLAWGDDRGTAIATRNPNSGSARTTG